MKCQYRSLRSTSIIGAGIHGLSTAYHLSLELQASGAGSGADILVIDKTAIAAGASGIACGVVRNNYFQPAMRAPDGALASQSGRAIRSRSATTRSATCRSAPRSCMRTSPRSPEVSSEIGYTSDFIEGEADCARYMKGLFGDWQAAGITSVLHEKKGGYANNTASMLRARREGEPLRGPHPVRREGHRLRCEGGAIAAVETDQGDDQDATTWSSAPGRGSSRSGTCSTCPRRSPSKAETASCTTDVPMWTFWSLQEGTLGVDPNYSKHQ